MFLLTRSPIFAYRAQMSKVVNCNCPGYGAYLSPGTGKCPDYLQVDVTSEVMCSIYL